MVVRQVPQTIARMSVMFASAQLDGARPSGPYLGEKLPPHLREKLPPHLREKLPPHLGEKLPPHLGEKRR